MLEYLAPGFIYSVGKDLWAYARGRRRRLKPEQVLELRQKWKKEFEPVLWKRVKDKYGMDVVIRDMRRLNDYPEAKEVKQGKISAWFKVGLMATYHNGIEVGLRWEELVKEANGWRLPRYNDGERGLNTCLLATIPYERIERVDWSGDNYYGDGHIYCHFEAKDGTPYDEMYYAEEHENSLGQKFYLKVADAAKVRENSKKAGTWWTKPKTLRERLGMSPKLDV